MSKIDKRKGRPATIEEVEQLFRKLGILKDFKRIKYKGNIILVEKELLEKELKE